MPKYYFDLCDDGAVAVDEEGMELSSLAAVQAEVGRRLQISCAKLRTNRSKTAPPFEWLSRCATTRARCYESDTSSGGETETGALPAHR
jgi:hypothetical protein